MNHSSKFIPGVVLSGASELIAELGGDAIAIADSVGLPDANLNDTDIPVEIGTLLRFCDAVADSCNCRNYGLIMAARSGLDVFGPLWVLLRSAKTLRQMLEDLESHYDMYTRAATISLEESGNSMSLCWDTSSALGANTTQATEYGFALGVYECRKFLPKFTPLAVQFRHAAPQELSLHRELFGPGLSFNQDRNAIHFPKAFLDIPLPTADGRSHSLMRSMLRWNPANQSTALPPRVENIVRALLPYSACTVDEVTSALGMSERSLQDHWKKSQTSFKKIKDSVRYDLALKYLKNSDLSLAEISEILGYSELSAFSRSFKRWHGQAASQVRRDARD